MILVLSKAVEINGEVKKEINYDLEDLKGDAIEKAMKDMQKAAYVPTVQEVDPVLHAHLFAESAGLDYNDIKRLSAKDYMKAVGVVRDFLLPDSEDFQEKTTSEQ